VRWDRSGAHGRTIVMDTLERSGFAIVEDALSADAVAHLTSAVDRVAAERGGDSIHELGFVGLDPAFVELVDHPLTLPIVLNALGSNIFLYHCHLDVHPPAPPHGRWGWHQDGGRQNVDLPSPRPKLSLKVAFFLTDVEEETQAPMWIVPGSHRRDRLERDNTRPTGATPLLVSAGTAVIFDRRLWHARGDNTSTRTRKALFYAYTYRWIRARDDLRGVDAKFLDTLDPVRRRVVRSTARIRILIKVQVGHVDRWGAMHLIRSRATLFACVVVAATVPSAARSADPGVALRQVVLRSAQVGQGYVRKAIRGGGEVRGQVTLDLCGFSFASENRRTGRLQVAYIRRGTTLALSNEVVSYRPGGTALAMKEVERAVRSCPPHEVRSTVRGVPPLRYRFTRLSTAGKGLLPGAIVVRMIVSGTVNGKKLTETSFGVYQGRANILSGVYVYGGSVEKRRTMAFEAAAASARNLKKHA
jgi:ectoine hydroxylase